MTARLRLLAVAGLLASQLACLDLEHHVEIHPTGAIDYVLRLGLDAKYANGPLAKPKDEREREWKARVPPQMAQYVEAHVEETPATVWLVIDAAVPDLSVYDAFRDAFIHHYESEHKPNPLFYPPAIEKGMGSYLVQADVRPSEETFPIPPEAKLGTNTWRLIVTGDRAVEPSSGALASNDGRTATFERPLLDVASAGTYAEVRVPVGVDSWVYVVLGVVVGLGAIAGGASLIARRQRRTA
jgi:hypothetical protein